MIKTYQRIFERMKAVGLGAKKHYLDNEALDDYKAAMRKMTVRSNKSHLVITDATLQREQSTLPRTTLYPYWQVQIYHS